VPLRIAACPQKGRPCSPTHPSYPAHEGEDIAADSTAMRKILRELEKGAPTDATVLLLGETGTGKEVLAHTISQMSPRRHHPFI